MLLAALMLGLASLACAVGFTPPGPAPDSGVVAGAPTVAPQPDVQGETAVVTHIVDGDTIDVRLDGTVYRVRYIGMNTPESNEPCYQDAKDANAALVSGKTVTMARDVSETDVYGRLLRYVYVGNVFVNAELVADGWAENDVYPPDTRYADNFRQLEVTATAANLGCHPTGVFDDGSDTR